MIKRKYRFLIGASILILLSIYLTEVSFINSKTKIKKIEATIKKNNENMNSILDSNKKQMKKIDLLQKQIKELQDKNKKLQEKIKRIGEPMDF